MARFGGVGRGDREGLLGFAKNEENVGAVGFFSFSMWRVSSSAVVLQRREEHTRAKQQTSRKMSAIADYHHLTLPEIPAKKREPCTTPVAQGSEKAILTHLCTCS